MCCYAGKIGVRLKNIICIKECNIMGEFFTYPVSVAVLAYFVGSIPFGSLFAKVFGQGDLGSKGSGSTGSTNVLRVAGKMPALLTFVCDLLKGVVVVLIARALVPDTEALAAFFGVLGHTASVFLKFKGGRGVATSFGVLIIIKWPLAVMAAGLWIVALLACRYVSVASMVACVGVIGCSVALYGKAEVFLTSLLAGMVLLSHHHNMVRLWQGEESKIGQVLDAHDKTDVPAV